MVQIKHTTILLLLSFLLLNGCERSSSSNTVDNTRVVFEPYVHSKIFGDYVIHINAVTTDQLPQEVARGYQISRSKNRAMINISILKQSTQLPVTAAITIVTKNLSNQLKNIELREIKEGNPEAIYYIGELPVSHEETLVFDVDVTPTGAAELLKIRYRQQFYTL